MIKYKIDIIKSMINNGYNTNRIRKEKLLSENTLSHLRNNQYISLYSIDVICKILKCQPGDILEYEEDSKKS